MQFSANISMLYSEVPFLQRFPLVRAAGFGAVEFWWPQGVDLDDLLTVAKANELDVALINFDGGDLASGERGLLSDPLRLDQFRANVPVALELASSLGCTSLNALVGLRIPDQSDAEQLDLAVSSVGWAADEAERTGARVLIEPINPVDMPLYLLQDADSAAAFIKMVDRPNVALQYDTYHARRAGGDPAEELRAHHHSLGHVQFADSPDRHEPGTGEIDFTELLGLLQSMGYTGYVGLEYLPLRDSEQSFAWIPRDQRTGQIDPSRF